MEESRLTHSLNSYYGALSDVACLLPTAHSSVAEY